MNYPSKDYGPTINGMLYKLDMIKAISNNIANAGTVGFKRDIPEAVNFKSVLDETALKDQQSGPLDKTNNKFDLAIEGNASFLVEGPDGPITTRLGNFKLNEKGNLANGLGQELIIIEKTDKDISLAKSENVKINQNGEIFIGSERFGRIAMQISDSNPVKVHQGFIEGSNVNMMNEMASLSLIFRSFESSQQVLGMEASVDKELIEKYGRNV